MSTTSETVLALVVIAIASLPLSYALGWMFSLGFHRGKRQYVHRMLTDSIFDGKE